MSEKSIPKGYLINQYQYARRYRYKSSGCIFYFNKMLEGHERKPQRNFLAFGDFDMLEFISVDTFREYYDVSTQAKQWLGKRQTVLLYDISQKIAETDGENVSDDDKKAGIGTTIVYRESEEKWMQCGSPEQELQGRFFCLSMLSITNEISQEYVKTSTLLKLARLKIHEIVDKINSTLNCKIHCEVYGSLNTAELGIIFISDEYVDVLRILDTVKHIRVRDEEGHTYPVFLNCYSTIGISDEHAAEVQDDTAIKGKALVQIAIQDLTDSHDALDKLAHDIAGESSGDKIAFSVGEYDLAVEVDTKRAIQLIRSDGLLSMAKKNPEQTEFIDDTREVLRNNIRLFYTRDMVPQLDDFLNQLETNGELNIRFTAVFDDSKQLSFEKEELIEDEPGDSRTYRSNETYYRIIRRELKKRIRSSAGAIDTLDMLYTDYKSIIASAYSAVWVSDLHRQFKSALHSIYEMLQSREMEWSWDGFHDVTNAFKQQIYHLSQSSRLFFEIPSCHLRSTGQYDFLMHAYYGITKKIIEIIYRIQQKDNQSELVPLITVNTVPQVTTELFFEVGNHSGMRTVNLNVPNSIVFNFNRGIGYLTHELFHYAVPEERSERNYRISLLYLTQIFKSQVLNELRNLVVTGMDLTVKPSFNDYFSVPGHNDNGMPGFLVSLFNISDSSSSKALMGIEDVILEIIIRNYESHVQKYLKPYQDSICNKFESAVVFYALKEQSDALFEIVFTKCFEILYAQAQKQLSDSGAKADENDEAFLQRLEYCKKNVEKFKAYVREIPQRRLPSRANRLNINDDDKYIRSVLEPCRSALKEACSDVAMVSLNGMALNDYLLFCVQNWKDAFEHSDNRNMLEIMRKEYEMQLRIAFVAEYFYQKNEPGWEIPRTDGYASELPSGTIRAFRHAYSWLYAPGKVIAPDKSYIDELAKRGQNVNDVRADAARTLNNDADAWIRLFLDSYDRFKQDYAVYWDNCIFSILDNYHVKSRQEKMSDIDKASKEKVKQDLVLFRNIQEKYRQALNGLPELSLYVHKDSCFNVDEQDLRYTEYLRSVFDINIEVADDFQRQHTLAALGEINREVAEKKKTFEEWRPHVTDSVKYKTLSGFTAVSEEKKNSVFQIHSLNELIFYLKYCSSEIKKDSKNARIKPPASQWFRGHANDRYQLLPSIIRKYSADKEKYFPTLRKYQMNEYEEFKFRADGAAEMPTGVRFTQSDYVALMQHYAVPTNFLDWTENVFTSLYFALENFFDFPDRKERVGRGLDRDAVIYIFSPGLYNHMRTKAIEDALAHIPGEYRKYFPERLTKANIIPNLSTKYNEQLYHMYILGDESFDEFLKDEDCYHKLYEDMNLRKLCLPLAIWTSRLNSRIRTQSGCFVAFNLYAPPGDITNRFLHCELEDVQKNIFGTSEYRYLYKIVINKDCCEEIVDWLKAMGISREKIYPELEKLKERFD